MQRLAAWIGLALSLALVLGLRAQTPTPPQEIRIMRGTTDEELARFTVEIADEPAEQQRGLMERPTLAPEAGMLFIFPESMPRAFWMMNTWIALDMLFIDGDKRILNIQENAMPCQAPRPCVSYPSAAPARYVLEIAGGRARALGIRAGDRVHF